MNLGRRSIGSMRSGEITSLSKSEIRISKSLPSPKRLRAGRRNKSSVVSLKLLYNDNKGCHSRENGNPAEKIGFPRIKYGAGLIKSGMTFCVKFFLRQYTRIRITKFPKPYSFFEFCVSNIRICFEFRISCFEFSPFRQVPRPLTR
jgi:hypothetical protein